MERPATPPSWTTDSLTAVSQRRQIRPQTTRTEGGDAMILRRWSWALVLVVSAPWAYAQTTTTTTATTTTTLPPQCVSPAPGEWATALNNDPESDWIPISLYAGRRRFDTTSFTEVAKCVF